MDGRPVREDELKRLLALPWTVLAETTPEGERVLRVREIPSAIGHGETTEELEADLWESLAASLRAYLHFGDAPPLPDRAPAWRLQEVTAPDGPVADYFVPELATSSSPVTPGDTDSR